MYTPIKLDKVRNFRYGMKALSLIEKTLSKSISTIDFANLTIEEIVTFLWAGLIHEDKELTIEGLMDIIDDSNVDFTTLTQAMGEAITGAFGKPKEATENPNQATVA